MGDKSIWYKEVDTALIELIQSTVTYDGKPIYAYIRSPELPFKKIDNIYPSISFSPLYSRPSKDRDDPNLHYIRVGSTATDAIMEKTASPYTLTYQIDFWSKYREDMDNITKQWLFLYSNYFNLPVKDASGNASSCFARTKDTIRAMNILDNEGNIFHSMQTLTIEVSIDLGLQITEKIVTDILVNTDKEM